MSDNVKIILGSHGAGKSNWIYNYFFCSGTKDGKIDLSKRFYLVVPEQDTNDKQHLLMKEAEKRNLGAGIINMDVVSFDRIAHIVFDILNIEPKNENVIDDDAKTMMLSLTLSRLSSEKKIKYYNRMINKMGFAKKLTQVVSEFYSYNIKSEDIDKVIEKSNEDWFKAKLSDLKIIYEEFKKDLKEKNFSIKEDKYNLLGENVDKINIFDDAIVAFDGFTGFTPVQLDIFKKIAKKAKEVYVTIDIRCKKNDVSNITASINDMSDVFYLSKKFINDIAKSLVSVKKELPVENYIYVDEKKKWRGKADLQYLEEHIFDYKNKNINKTIKPDNIELYSYKNTDEEVLNVAGIIKHFTRDLYYKYSDIKIVVPSLSDYTDKFIRTFSKYNIPLFIDDTSTLLNSPYIETIRAAIDVINYDFTYDGVMRYINAGLIEKDENVNILDNTILRYGIRGYKRYKDGFEKLHIKDTKRDSILKVKNEIITPLLNLRDNVYSDLTISSFINAIKIFIDDIKLDERYEKFCEEFSEKEVGNGDYRRQSAILRESIKVTKETLENILIINKESTEKISLNDFKKVLDVGFFEKGVKSIPYTLDQVVIGDVMRSRFDNPKVLIFMGLNESKIPSKSKDVSLLDDFLRDRFNKENINLSQTTTETVLNQRFYTYLILTNPTEKLILTYPKQNAEDSVDGKSQIIKDIEKLFSEDNLKLIEKKIDEDNINLYTNEDLISFVAKNIQDIKKNTDSKEVKASIKLIRYLKNNIKDFDDIYDRILNQKNYIKNENINEKLSKKLANISSNVTKVELYNTCPYKYFLSETLDLNEREKYEISSLDLGNFFHKALEILYKKINDISKLSEDDIEKKVDDVLSDISYNDGTNLEKFAELDKVNKDYYGVNKLIYIKKRARRILISSLIALSRISKDSELKHIEVENVFNCNIDGYAFSGKIDKIESIDDGSSTYLNVIDYKSGIKKLKIEDIEAGVNIQLMLYLDSCLNMKKTESKNAISCGSFYFTLKDPIVKITDIKSVDEVNEKKLAEYNYVGIQNADKNVMAKLGASANRIMKNCIELDDNKLKEKIQNVREKIKESIDNINTGVIDIRPYDENNCNYCPYGTICRKDMAINVEKIDE